jgi:hypothetical protein
MKKMFILAIIAIVMVSGCIDNPSQTQTDIESNDIIAVTSPSVIPATIYNGDSFDINFQVTNTHDTRDINDVSVWIENWNPCKLNAINGLPVEEGKSFYLGFEEGITKLTAGSSLPVGLTLTGTTPDENLPGICKIIYRMNYGLKAVTTFSGISIMESGAYRALLKSGEKPSESPSQNIGTGPIKMIFDTEQRFPIEAVTGKQLSMSMKIENRGSGVFGDVPIGSVKLKVPKDLLFLSEDGTLLEEPCDRFSVIVDEQELENGITGNILLEGETTVEDCTDGVDNDGDSLVDCEDPNCDNKFFNDLGYKCFAKYKNEINCTDGLDNDEDGMTDCVDNNCALKTECRGPDGEYCLVSENENACEFSFCNDMSCGFGCLCSGSEETTEEKIIYVGESDTTSSNGIYYMIEAISYDSPEAVINITYGETEKTITLTEDVKTEFEGMKFILKEKPDTRVISEPGVVFDITYIKVIPKELLCYIDELAQDNDLDGLFGSDDPDCKEFNEICDDGKDNDLDSFVDCDDTDCSQDFVCGYIEESETTCDDGLDNDADEKTDCADTDCDTKSCGDGCTCAGGIKTETNCFDTIDNDGDGVGLYDCNDQDCKTAYPEICHVEEDQEPIEVTSDEDYIVFTNGKKIPMLDDVSIMLRCTFNADIEVPYEKTYYIQAEYDYEYEIRDEIEVDIIVE